MEFTRPRLAKEVVEKVEDLLEQHLTFSQIVKQTGVSKGSISKIKNGTYKKAPVIQETINEKEYTALKENYAKIKQENEVLKKNNDKLMKYVKSLKGQLHSFQALNFYINKLGYNTDKLEYYVNYLRNNPTYNINNFYTKNDNKALFINVQNVNKNVDDDNTLYIDYSTI